MYTALFTLAFHRLFWLGEVTLTPHTVFQQNMLFGPNEMHIKMPMSECHKISMPPQRTVIPRSTSIASLSSAIIKDLFSLSGSARWPTLHQARRIPALPQRSSCHSQESLCHMQLSHQFIKPHSFHIGGMTHLHLLGYPQEYIRDKGRWSSECFRKYICLLLPSNRTLQKFLALSRFQLVETRLISVLKADLATLALLDMLNHHQ